MFDIVTYDQLTCGVEWHLRDHPRAFALYSFALDSAKGGTFSMSRTQVAQFFGWDIKTVRSAFAVLLDSGWFEPVDANAYRIVPHSELHKEGDCCWPEKGGSR